MRPANELLEQILAKRGDIDANANELLGHFFRGYPLEKLSRILRSDDNDVSKIGVWIASELGARATAILNDIVPLLRHPTPYARFFAIDSILSSSTAINGEAIAAVVGLISDPDQSVRWKVFQFLARASMDQLRSALMHLDGDSPHAQGIRHLLEPLRGNEIISLLEGSNSILKRFGLAATVRISGSDDSPLQAATNSGDDEIRSWAEEELKRTRCDVTQ